MKSTILLDSGVISLYQSNHKEVLREIKTMKKNQYNFISSEVNYIELFNHLCREKGKINAQVIMENLRQGSMIKFIPISEKISILAGEIAEALTRNIIIFTTESHFSDIENLKVKKIDF